VRVIAPSRRDHFKGERVGTPFPLLKCRRNAWERCCKETKALLLIRMEFISHSLHDMHCNDYFNYKSSVVWRTAHFVVSY